MNIVNVGYRSTNYYILADTKGGPRLLIDVGWPGTLRTFQHACNLMDINLSAIPYQLITHYHPDHAGIVQELKHLGVHLIVIGTQLAAIPLLRTYVKPEDKYVDIEIAGNTILTLEETRPFLARIGIEGEIISTPGHSDDSITLVLDNGAAFTGDLTPQMLVPNDPCDPAYQSWNAIRSKGATTIYPGHGPPFNI